MRSSEYDRGLMESGAAWASSELPPAAARETPRAAVRASRVNRMTPQGTRRYGEVDRRDWDRRAFRVDCCARGLARSDEQQSPRTAPRRPRTSAGHEPGRILKNGRSGWPVRRKFERIGPIHGPGGL